MTVVNKPPRPDNRLRRSDAAPALFQLLSDSALSRAALGACTLPVAMMEAVPPHSLTYVNPAFEGFFGLAAREALGRPLSALLLPGDEKLIQLALAEPTSPCQLRTRCKDGETRHVELAAGPLRSVDGRVTHWIMAFSDRSEVVRLRAELDGLKRPAA